MGITQGVFILLTTSGNGSFFNGQGRDGRHGHKWTRLYGQNGHVQQVTSLKLSIPSIKRKVHRVHPVHDVHSCPCP
jgi:hypothetical protein